MIGIDAARTVAERHLADAIGPDLDDGALLVAACWLHDVGYAPDLVKTQFHPLDGARALRPWGADDVVCGLVAHHSAASHEADVLGLLDELEAFTDPHGIVRDLLWYLGCR